MIDDNIELLIEPKEGLVEVCWNGGGKHFFQLLSAFSDDFSAHSSSKTDPLVSYSTS